MFPKEIYKSQLREHTDDRLFASATLTLHDEYPVRSAAEHLYGMRQRCVEWQL